MATTLWVTSVFGDSRQTIGAIVIVAWIAPLVIRRLRRRPGRAAPRKPAPCAWRPAARRQQPERPALERRCPRPASACRMRPPGGRHAGYTR